MYGYQMNEYDKWVYETQLKDFLPDKIIDIHNHVYKAEFKKQPAPGAKRSWVSYLMETCELEDLLQTYKDMFPGKITKPAIMGAPAADHKINNQYIEDMGKKHDLSYFYLVKYNTPAEEIEDALANRGFCGIKPYASSRPPYIPVSESRIFDFLPHEQLEVINKYKGVVILHIGRDGRLKDPVNYRQILEIEEKYPDLQLVVAHIGRAYTPEDFGDAFDYLKNTEHLVFDFCATTLSEAIYRCIEAVGTKRILFGTDMPVSKMRMRRVTKNGMYYNIIPKGLYGDASSDPHIIEYEDGSEITNFAYEEIKAFKRAAQELGLSKQDVEDAFYGNAARILNARGGHY